MVGADAEFVLYPSAPVCYAVANQACYELVPPAGQIASGLGMVDEMRAGMTEAIRGAGITTLEVWTTLFATP